MNNKNEYVLKSDVEKILTECAIKAWQEVERIIKEVFANTDIKIMVCDWH